jgi:5-formyltetrahydrofolate cyclo-ligase
MELESLKKILKKMMHGDIEKIAASTARSKNAVYQVFRKESFVASVIEAALNAIETNALESLKFVKEKRAELKKSADDYETKKRKQLEKRQQKQAA